VEAIARLDTRAGKRDAPLLGEESMEGTMRAMRQRLTYANVVSTICLFLVLGGGTAVALRGQNTVFSDDIVNGQVRTPDLANNAVNTTRIAAGAVRSGDIGAGAVGARQIANGSIGEAKLTPGLIQAAGLNSVTGRDDGTVSLANNPGPVNLGGPSVNVTVPANGYLTVSGGLEIQSVGADGSCKAKVVSTPAVPGSLGDFQDFGQGFKFSGTVASRVIPAGEYTLRLDYGTFPGVSCQYRNRRITATVVTG
jgi:hypothetical protein